MKFTPQDIHPRNGAVVRKWDDGSITIAAQDGTTVALIDPGEGISAQEWIAGGTCRIASGVPPHEYTRPSREFRRGRMVGSLSAGVAAIRGAVWYDEDDARTGAINNTMGILARLLDAASADDGDQGPPR